MHRPCHAHALPVMHRLHMRVIRCDAVRAEAQVAGKALRGKGRRDSGPGVGALATVRAHGWWEAAAPQPGWCTARLNSRGRDSRLLARGDAASCITVGVAATLENN